MRYSLSLILLSFTSLFSQENKPTKTGYDYGHYFTLQTGFGTTHNAMIAALGYNNYGWVNHVTKSTSAPGLALNYEYFVASRFSVNACLSMNSATLEANAPLMPSQKGRVITWSSRFLIHFLHLKSIKSNLYAGVGAGVGMWSFKPEKTYNQIVNGSIAQFSAPLYLGYRYFFKDNLGATLEVSSFKNNSVSAGLTFRF